ncbi:MAG: NAD(P)-dependent oxidoreductase [Saprospirales bacterium]|nr:NAD(P)-dependent oxidoreductase [Saprospirales bacterium]
MKKLLVTGASGFLGWNVFKVQPPDWRLIGTWNKHEDGLWPRSENYQLDLRDKDAVWKCLKEINPDAVLHLAAFSDTNFCEENPEKAKELNVDATATLAGMCADRHVHLLFTSSEQVFDGTKEAYQESDAPNPKNEYGRQKLEAEQLVQAIYPEASVVRISVMYGLASAARPGFLQKWLDAWQHFFPVKAFYDEYRSFLGGASAARGLFHLLGQQASGIFHIGGDQGLSRYDLALLVKERFRLEHAPVEICSQKDVNMPAFRPPRLVLDNSLIAGTGFQPMPLDQELDALVQEFKLPPPFSDN